MKKKVEEELRSISRYRHQLLFLTGNLADIDFQQLAEELNCSYVNVNLELSRKLLEFPVTKRVRKAPECLQEILNERSSKVFLLDHIDVLFHPSLQLNPGALLENLSRNYVFIIPWYGAAGEDELVYAEPGYPEFFQLPCREFIVVHI